MSTSMEIEFACYSLYMQYRIMKHCYFCQGSQHLFISLLVC